jgi:hypothetical protein
MFILIDIIIPHTFLDKFITNSLSILYHAREWRSLNDKRNNRRKIKDRFLPFCRDYSINIIISKALMGATCMKMDTPTNEFQLPASNPNRAKSVSNVTRDDEKKKNNETISIVNTASTEAARSSIGNIIKAEPKRQENLGPKICIDDFVVFGKIGTGTYGMVYAGYLKK